MIKLIYDSEPDYKYFNETKDFLMRERPFEFGEVSDEVVFDYMQEEKQYEWEELEPHIEKLFIEQVGSTTYDKPFVVQASIGKWNGTFAGGRILYGYQELKNEILSKYDRIVINDVDGTLEIVGYHHDGISSFSIRLINDRGEKYLNNRYTDSFSWRTRECVEDMARSHWSKKPNLYKLIQKEF